MSIVPVGAEVLDVGCAAISFHGQGHIGQRLRDLGIHRSVPAKTSLGLGIEMYQREPLTAPGSLVS